MKRRKSNQDRRRKEEKKLERMRLEEANDRNKWIITILVVILIFVGFYFLSIYVTNKNKEKKTNTKDMTGEIILGKSFSMSSQDYYVLYYDSTDKIVAGTCKDLFSSYHSAHGEGSIYYVDMNSGFNKPFVTDGESNKAPGSEKELSINGPTLIKVSQNALVEYVEGLEAIEEHLK